MSLCQVTRWKKIVKIRPETNGKENRKTIQKINKTKSWFVENINKTDKLLARVDKKKRKMIQVYKIINGKGDN